MNIIPPYLINGDTIGIVCPAGYMPLKKITSCVTTLNDWGFKVKIGTTLGKKQVNYFSGNDEKRLSDFQTMLDDDTVQAILCARGGYGTSRIIDRINFSKFKKNPKWIIGFSDITVLHAHINKQFKIATLHAPMAGAFNNEGFKNEFVLSLKKALKGNALNYTCKPFVLNNIGTTKGELIGGNLALISHLIGSKSAYITKNKILFLEDVGEYLYNIDRMFVQLKRAGIFNELKGLVLGGFTELKDTKTPFGTDVYNLIYEHIKEYSFPFCFNFPVSHDKENVALKTGVDYEFSVQKNKVLLKEIRN